MLAVRGGQNIRKSAVRLPGTHNTLTAQSHLGFVSQLLVGFLQASGGSLAALQELLGHAHIATTMRYARLTEDLVEREADRVFKGRERA